MGLMVNSNGKAPSMAVGLFWGGVTSLASTLVLSAVLSWLVLSQRVGEDKLGYGVMVLLAAASFLGAKISCRKVKRQRIAVSCMAGGAYMVTLLAMTALFFDGQYEGVGETALMVLCGCGLAVLLHREPKARQKPGKKRKVYR